MLMKIIANETKNYATNDTKFRIMATTMEQDSAQHIFPKKLYEKYQKFQKENVPRWAEFGDEKYAKLLFYSD